MEANLTGLQGSVDSSFNSKLQSPFSPAVSSKTNQKERNNQHFEHLMAVGSQTTSSPTKQSSSHTKDEKEEESKLKQKEFRYSDPGVKIGSGKFGPVNLIIHEGKLYALKVIPKSTIDKPKRIEHVKNEK